MGETKLLIVTLIGLTLMSSIPASTARLFRLTPRYWLLASLRATSGYGISKKTSCVDYGVTSTWLQLKIVSFITFPVSALLFDWFKSNSILFPQNSRKNWFNDTETHRTLSSHLRSFVRSLIWHVQSSPIPPVCVSGRYYSIMEFRNNDEPSRL
jgi:hypothetical protein